MSLTAAEVAEIMRLVEQSQFDELKLDLEGTKLTLRRSGADQTEVSAPRAAVQATPIVVPDGTTGPLDPGLREVTSPMLGTFYRAPKPGAAPFVEVGAVVEEDSVIGIIEVMKLMNTVRAGARGTIAEILPADESLVEYGEVLMRIREGG